MQLPNNIQLLRPIHSLNLPVLGKTINIRPYTTDEEKTIITASEEKEKSTQLLLNYKQLVKNCIDEDIDLEKISYLDFMYIAIALRCISKDPTFEGVIKECLNEECKSKFDFEINIIDNIIFKNKEVKYVNFDIDKNVRLILKHTNLNYIFDIKDDDDEIQIAKNLISHSIKTVIYFEKEYVNIDPAELIEKIISQMSPYHIEKCLSKMNELTTFEFKIDIICPVCGNSISESVDNFLK